MLRALRPARKPWRRSPELTALDAALIEYAVLLAGSGRQVAKIVGRSPGAVSQWRASKRLPPPIRRHLLFYLALDAPAGRRRPQV